MSEVSNLHHPKKSQINQSTTIPKKIMSELVKLLNNCLELFTLCKPKDSSSTNNDTSNRNTDNTQVEGEKLIPDMSDYFTLILPARPKFGDEIRVKAKLKERPKQ